MKKVIAFEKFVDSQTSRAVESIKERFANEARSRTKIKNIPAMKAGQEPTFEKQMVKLVKELRARIVELEELVDDLKQDLSIMDSHSTGSVQSVDEKSDNEIIKVNGLIKKMEIFFKVRKKDGFSPFDERLAANSRKAMAEVIRAAKGINGDNL